MKNLSNSLGANILDTNHIESMQSYGRLNPSFELVNPNNISQYNDEAYESFNYLNYENGNSGILMLPILSNILKEDHYFDI